MSNTFAKYTSTITGSDSSVVAKWDVSDGDTLAQPTITVDVTFTQVN